MLFSLLFALVLAGDTLSVPVEGEERQLLNFGDCLKLTAAKIAGAGMLPFKGAGLGLVAEALCNEEFKLSDIGKGKVKGKKDKGNDRIIGTLWDMLSKLSEKPEAPKLPELPEIPKIPKEPELPKIPGLPEIPKIPDLPEIPKIPGLPDIPKVPELPEIPKIPELPEIPKIPGLPEIPEIPDSGKGKDKGKDDKGKDHGKGKDKGKDDHKKGKDKGKDKGKGKGPFGLF